MKRRARSLLALGSIPVAALLAPACAGDGGAGVVVIMRTDMTFPDKVDQVGLFIEQLENGRSTSLLARVVPTSLTPDGTTSVRLPTELAIESNGKQSQVRVRVVAYSRGVAIAMRESQATVSTDQIQALPMPILWMNQEELTPLGGDAAALGNLQSGLCGANSTLGDDGDCVPIELATLAALDAEAPLPTEAAACNPNCFDVSQCFKPEFAEDLDEDFRAARAPIGWFDEEHTQCGVPLGARGEMARAIADRAPKLSKDLAIAVRVARQDGAHCTQQDPDECYVVIDAATKTQIARKQTARGERLWALLPKGICRKWEEGKIIRNTAVAVPGCMRKKPGQTFCTSQEVGCTTDEGWTGRKNPRAGRPGSPPSAGSACQVPGATSILATGDALLAMTNTGQIVQLPLSLENCAPASSAAGVGDGVYRLAGEGSEGTVGFMRLGDKAGVATRGTGGYEPVVPQPVLASDKKPWGVGFSADRATDCFVYPGGGLFGESVLGSDARTPFTAVSNGVQGPGTGITFATSDGEELALLQCPVDVELGRSTQRQPTGLTDPSIPLHVARVRSSLFVLLKAPDGTPGLARYDGLFEQSLQKLSLALPADEAPMGTMVSEMTLAAGSQSLFFGDSTGRIYRVSPRIDGNDPSAEPVEVAYRGYEPVHSVYYTRIPKAAGSTIDGFLYWITWPDGESAKARVQRVGLDATGGIVLPPDPAEAGVSSSSSGNASSSGSGNASSSGSSTSGNPGEGGASSSSSSSSGVVTADAAVPTVDGSL